MLSKITGGETIRLFSAKVLGKYEVDYFQCRETGFIQTQQPYWLQEAYQSAIASLDVGIVRRNGQMAIITERILSRYFKDGNKFLDYGGGYGHFVRLMRDSGFNFFLFDEYAENFYARFFEIKKKEDLLKEKFGAITAFEVFEHLVDPAETLQELLQYSDSILFSTELVPDQQFTSAADWWYFAPETGQHISFYSLSSLQYLAKKMQFNFYSNNTNLHLFTLKTFEKDPFIYLRSFKVFDQWSNSIKKLHDKLWKVSPRVSLIHSDSELVKRIIEKGEQP